MSIRIFIGNRSEFAHETAQQNEIFNVLKSHEISEDVFLLLNVRVWNNVEIDCAILTTFGAIILELKNYRGQISGAENGDWNVVKNNGETLLLPTNLIQQLAKERANFNKSIVDIGKRKFPHIPDRELRKTEAWGYFRAGSNYTGEVTRDRIKWFDIVTADTLAKTISFENSGIFFSPEDLEAIVCDLHLTECAEDFFSQPEPEGADDEPVIDDIAQPQAPVIAVCDEPLSYTFSLVESSLKISDLKLHKMAQKIPDGPQRIRGVAGSGKTTLLCQMAAYMHTQHPEWDIAFVFFTRSLYQEIEEKVKQSIAQFGGVWNQNKLLILHAWGGRTQAGLYSTICGRHGVLPKTPGTLGKTFAPVEGLAFSCQQLLKNTTLHPIFDAILIDEGQDLIVDNNEVLYEGKQPIYWLAHQSLRPIDNASPNTKRLIWAYDEYQSMSSMKIPTAQELFGDSAEFNNIFFGNYKNGLKKSVIMKKCCRTPGPILIAAHAIGMGLLRPDGMIAGPTTQEEWRALGYEINGTFKPNTTITLTRPGENSRNIIGKIFPDRDLIDFHTFNSKEEEYLFVARAIKKNIEQDFLDPSRQILVISLAKGEWVLKKIASVLTQEGINYYIAAAPDMNLSNYYNQQKKPNQFRMDYAVTLSQVIRAKGNESDVVYVTDLDRVARQEQSVQLRNLIFTALTRTRGFVNLTGTDNYPMYDEIREIIKEKNTIKFAFMGKPKISRDIKDELKGEGGS